MNTSRFVATALGGILLVGAVEGTSSIAQADTASTAAIIAGAAAITGALLYDSSNRPYYVRNNHRYYVSSQEAQYYRGHHQGVERRAYVPEKEYPVARAPQRASQHSDGGHGNAGHGNAGHGGGHDDHH